MSARQIRLNGLFTVFGFLLGAINVLLLYTRVFSLEVYGTISFVLASATLLFPLVSLGMQQTVLRYYEEGDELERNKTLSSSLQLVSLFSLLLLSIVMVFGSEIALYLSTENKVDTTAVYAITVIAVLMAYFELFFAFTKVQFKTAFGVFLKEVFPRLGILVLLVSHFLFPPLTLSVFLLATSLIYLIRALLMAGLAYQLRPFTLTQLGTIIHYRKVLVYSLLVVLGSGLSMAFLEIDKFMLHTLSTASNVALYAVFVFMATTIAIPLRSIQPLYNAECAALQSQQNLEDLKKVVQKAIAISSYYGVIILGGLLTFQPALRYFLPDQYHSAFTIFPLLLALKFIDSSFTPLNALFYYSKFYKTYLLYSIGFLCTMIGLNALFIPQYGILGAALATTGSILLFVLVKIWASNKFLQIQVFSPIHLWPALFGLAFVGLELSFLTPWITAIRLTLLTTLVFFFWRKGVFSKDFLSLR